MYYVLLLGFVFLSVYNNYKYLSEYKSLDNRD